jgi:hypothetical protein
MAQTTPDAIKVIEALEIGAVNADNLAEWTEAALAVDWDAAYETTREDDSPTDESCELGDFLEAVYWYCVHCHGGQGSQEYALQCAVGSVFTPGCSDGPELETTSADMYKNLCRAAGCDDSL